MDPASVIKEAAEAIRIAETSQALDLLLSLWREHYDEAVADAIGRLGFQLSERLPPLAGNASQRQRRWMELAKSREAASLDLLLSSLTQGSMSAAKRRITALHSWPLDPRIDRYLVHLLEAPPYLSRSSRGFWNEVFARCRSIHDPRSIIDLQKQRLSAVEQVSSELRRWFHSQLQALLAELTSRDSISPLPLPLDAREELAAIAVDRYAAKRARADKLLQQIYAHPGDDGLRQIYGDLLAELGEPRGEFIQLQYRALEGTLTIDQQRVMKELLRYHTRDWLVPLDRIINRDGLVFERGFLAACSVKHCDATTLAAAAGHPLWSTVRSIEAPPLIYLDPAMLSLREVVADADGIEDLCNPTHPRSIESLIYVGPRATNDRELKAHRGEAWPEILLDREEIAALRSSVGLPALRRLRFRREDTQPWWPWGGMTATHWSWLIDAPVLDRLEQLCIVIPVSQLGPWIELFVDSWRHPELSLELDLSMVHRCRLTALKGGTCTVDMTVVGQELMTHYQVDSVAGALDSIDEETPFERFTIRWSGPLPRKRERQTLAEAVDHHAGRITLDFQQA